MPAPYYVEPEYWIEGYAEGDAKIASAAASVSSAVSASTERIQQPSAAKQRWTSGLP